MHAKKKQTLKMLGKNFNVVYSQACVRLSQTGPFLSNMYILYCVIKLHARKHSMQ